MRFLTRSSPPSLPPKADHDIPPAAQKIATSIGRLGWVSFWVQLLAAAVIIALLVLAIIGRSLDESDRIFWVGLSIVVAIISWLTLLFAIWLALQLSRCARRLLLPYMQPTPRPQDVDRRVRVALFTSLIGLGISLFGTEISAVSLLAKTLAHPQGAAIYSPESTLRVLDVMVILIGGGLSITHFFGLAIYVWLYSRVQMVENPE